MSLFTQIKNILLELPIINMIYRYKSNEQIKAENPEYDATTDFIKDDETNTICS